VLGRGAAEVSIVAVTHTECSNDNRKTHAQVIDGRVRIHGVVVGNRDDLEALSRFLTAHKDLKPVIDSTFAPLEAAPAAFAAMQRGPMGKVVVQTSACYSRL